MQPSVVSKMRLDAVVWLLLLVPLLADKKISLRILAAVAQCEAICISDKAEWYKGKGKAEGRDAPQCLEEMNVSVTSTSCEEACFQIDYDACLHSCKCVQNLLESNDTEIRRSGVKGPHLTQPELYCREADILNLRWTAPMKLHPVFITEYREDGHKSWKIYNKTKEETELISGLSRNTRYQIRVRAFIRDGQLGPAVTSSWISTLNGSFTPGSVEDISVKNMTVVNRTLDAIVSWTPSWDRTCFYQFVLWNTQSSLPPIHVYLSQTLQFELKKLELGADYYSAVIATTRNSRRQSAKKELRFTTPSCLEMLPDPADCPPPTPQGLTVREEDSSIPGLFDIKVKWNISDPLPGYHLVSLTSVKPSPEEKGGFLLNHSVPGGSRETVFTGVPTVSRYRLSVVAVSGNGHKSEAAMRRRELIKIPDGYIKKHSRNMFTLVTSLSLILAGLTVGAVLVGIAYYRQRLKRRPLQLKKLEQEEEEREVSLLKHKASICKEQVNNDYYDDMWEISGDSLLPGKVLGSGAFGIVRKGDLKRKDGSWAEVAIKTLPNDYTPEDHRHFWQEINMMKNVGPHAHIVNLVGCCSRGGNLQLVVEFCALGDLQGYLRKNWAQISGTNEYYNANSNIKYAELSFESTGSEFMGGYAPSLDYCAKLQKKLTSLDLLSLARQIAIGMEYLASCRVVHRDLAARNVLLTKECTAKISDFGLSRDVYQENVYRKKGIGLLPVKWMALESLLHQIYTTQSDVWSFGILLWEIVTLGGSPYPGISMNKLFTFLKEGHRMEKPSNCSQELYEIMCACWRQKPADRPTFTELHQRLDVLLESSSPQKYLNLNLPIDGNNLERGNADSLRNSAR